MAHVAYVAAHVVHVVLHGVATIPRSAFGFCRGVVVPGNRAMISATADAAAYDKGDRRYLSIKERQTEQAGQGRKPSSRTKVPI